MGGFEVSADNPMGRKQIEKSIEAHNRLIVGTAPYVSCHVHPKTIEYREQRAQRNAGMPTAYQLAEAQRQHDIMNNLIKKARSCVDTSPPSLAWHHHQFSNQIRKKEAGGSQLLEDPGPQDSVVLPTPK